MRVRDVLGPLFADEDFTSEAFSGMFSDLGQPGVSPALLAMVTVLQFLDRLSDRDAVAAMADRISWKYLLSLEIEVTGFDASVLCEFRARLAETGRADALFDVMIGRLKGAGLVRARGRARTDSAHVLGAVRVLNRIELVVETLRCALEEIAALSPGLLGPLLDAGWAQRYGRRVELARLLGRASSKASADTLARQIATDGAALPAAIDADPAARWLTRLPVVALVREVWSQQVQADGKGGRRLKDPEHLAASGERMHSRTTPRCATARKAGAGTRTWSGPGPGSISSSPATKTCRTWSPTCTPPPRPTRT